MMKEQIERLESIEKKFDEINKTVYTPEQHKRKMKPVWDRIKREHKKKGIKPLDIDRAGREFNDSNF